MMKLRIDTKPDLGWTILALLTVLLVMVGCVQEGPPMPPSKPATKPIAAAVKTAPSPSGALAELNKMDTRKPLPLQPMMAWHQKQNMMEHLVAIQRITAGLAREDWDEIVEAAALIESSPQMEQMCRHMGSGAEGFTDMALEFHRRADAIAPAAKGKDGPLVLQATARTLEACTSCHATFRQDVVDATTWQARTGSDHAPSMQH